MAITTAAPPPPADLLDRVLAQWPDMRRYADTARIERLDYVIGTQRHWCWCITIDS